jgi:hypothetical protein
MAVVTVPTNPQAMRARAPAIEPCEAVLASLDRRSENIRVLPVVIAELEGERENY